MPVAPIVASPPLAAPVRAVACEGRPDGTVSFARDRFEGPSAAAPCEPGPPAEDPEACRGFLEFATTALEMVVTFLVGYTAPALFAAWML